MLFYCYNVINRYLFCVLNLLCYYFNVIKRYFFYVLNLFCYWYSVCVNKIFNIFIEVYKVVENVILDIYNLSCLGEVMGKVKNYFKIVINVIMKFYLKVFSYGVSVLMIVLNKIFRLY